jgi:hypothetical protein
LEALNQVRDLMAGPRCAAIAASVRPRTGIAAPQQEAR